MTTRSLRKWCAPHFFDGTAWQRADPPQWTIDTINNTMTFHTSHLSLWVATLTTRRPVVAVAGAAVIDNDTASNGDQRLLLMDIGQRDLKPMPKPDPTPTQPLFSAALPEADLLEAMPQQDLVRATNQYGQDAAAHLLAGARLSATYIKGVRPTGAGGYAVLSRTVWVVPNGADLSVQLTADIDQLTFVSATGEITGRLRPRLFGDTAPTLISYRPCRMEPCGGAGGCIVCDEPVDVLVGYHIQQSVRDYAFSPDGARLYLLADASWGDRLSAGDGLYMLEAAGLETAETTMSTGPDSALVIGDSASMTVSELWGPDTLFVIGSGPRGWAASNGRLRLSGGSTREIVQALGEVGDTALAAFGPYGGFEHTSLQALRGGLARIACPEYDISTDGMLSWVPTSASLQDVIAMDLAQIAADCGYVLPPLPPGSSADDFLGFLEPAERAALLAIAGVNARDPAHRDVVSHMLEAGQVLVLKTMASGVRRVGTIPIDSEPAGAWPPSTFAAGLSDPMSGIAVDSMGSVWVRQSTLEGERDGTTGRRLWLRSLTPGSRVGRIRLDTSVSIDHAVNAPLSVAQAALPHEDNEPPAIGRSSIAPLTKGGPSDIYGAVTVAPNKKIVAAIPKLTCSPVLGICLPGPDVQGVDLGDLPAAPWDDPTNTLATTYASSTSTFLGDGWTSDVVIAAVYDDDNPANDAESPPKSYLKLMRGDWSQGFEESKALWGVRGATEDPLRPKFRFDAGGQMPLAPVAVLQPRSTSPQHFPFPKPLVAKDGERFHIVRSPLLEGVRISLKRLEFGQDANGDPIVSTAATSLAEYQTQLDDRPLGTPDRSTLVLRVFLAGPLSEAEVLGPQMLQTHATGEAGVPTVLLHPSILDDYLMLFVANDDGSISRVADCCDDTSDEKCDVLGTVTPYTLEDASNVQSCGSDDRGVCLDVPLEDRQGEQLLFADVVVCGVASRNVPVAENKTNQRSLASEPLRVNVGPYRCDTQDVCPSNTFCVDGFCCNDPCGDGAQDDCQACSTAAGGSEDGICTPAIAGTICTEALELNCPLPRTCDGVNLTCPESLEASGLPHPNAMEVCNGRDDDCDGMVDEACWMPDCNSGPCTEFHPELDFAVALRQYTDHDSAYSPEHGPTMPVGTTPGHLHVDANGQARYSVPIAVPPGRRGMQPAISLEYSSWSRNGPVGVGWRIGGLSEIRRCSCNIAEDGYIHPVSFDPYDAFCLDGMRLVRHGGTCPNGGIDYRTKQNPFARVCAYHQYTTSGEDRGPSYFLIWSKDGRVLEYGTGGIKLAEFTKYDEGPQPVFSWPITRVEDRRGNYMTIDYVGAARLNGELPTDGNALTSAPLNPFYAPTRMEYTGHGSEPPRRAVVFSYESRPDIINGYYRGVENSVEYRLSAIRVYGVGTRLIREYRLAYELGATRRSRLTGIEECAGGKCKPPTTFKWSDTDHGSLALPRFTSTECHAVSLSDANAGAWPKTCNPYTGSHRQFAPDTIAFLDFGATNPVRVQRKTYNIDTEDEYVHFRFTAHSADGSSDFVEERHSPKLVDWWTGDFDGNGVTDLLVAEATGRRAESPYSEFTAVRFHALFNDRETVGDFVDLGIEAFMIGRGVVGDFDGDGRAELLFGDLYRQFMFLRARTLSGGLSVSGFPEEASTPYAIETMMRHMTPLDLNGDGLVDLVNSYVARPWDPDCQEILSFYGYMNTGNGFQRLVITDPVHHELITLSSIVGNLDLDGDGDQELLLSGWDAYVECNRCSADQKSLFLFDYPTGVTRSPGFGVAEDANLYSLCDLNQDGLTDIIADYATSQREEHCLYVRQGDRPDLLTEIRDGLSIGFPAPATHALRYAWGAADDAYSGREDDQCPGDNNSCLPPLLSLVSQVHHDSGTDDAYSHTYHYSDSRTNRSGLGWLGFATTSVTDGRTGSTTVRDYDKSTYVSYLGAFPFANFVVRSMTRVALGETSDGVIADLRVAVPGIWRHPQAPLFFSYEALVEEQVLADPEICDNNRDDDGDGAVDCSDTDCAPDCDENLGPSDYLDLPQSSSLLRSVRTTRVYDAYGNLTDFTITSRTAKPSTTTIGEFAEEKWLQQLAHVESVGSEVTVSHDVDNDELDWLIGRVKESTLVAKSSFCRALDDPTDALIARSLPWADSSTACPDGSVQTKSTTFDYYPEAGRRDLVWRIVARTDREEDTLSRELEYDDYGNLERVSDTGVADFLGRIETRTSSIEYDPAERIFPYRHTNALQHVTTWIYDRDLGIPVFTRFPTGVISLRRIDAFGHTTMEGASGSILTWRGLTRNILEGGYRERIEVPTGQWQTTLYDRRGRPVRNERPLGGQIVSSSRTYDALGRVRLAGLPHVVDSAEFSIAYDYDDLGRITSVDSGDGTTLFRYRGLLREQKEPDSTWRASVSGAHGGPVASFQEVTAFEEHPYRVITQYGHDALGEIAFVADGTTSPNVTRMVSDSRGRQIMLVDPDLGTRRSKYNAFGEQVWADDNSGQYFTFEYDPIGRPIASTSSEGATTWIWDVELPQTMHSMESPDGHAVQFGYDDFGRMTTTTVSVGGVGDFFVEQTHDAIGRLESLTYPSRSGTSLVIGYTYSSDGLEAIGDITASTGRVQPFWNADQHDQFGNVTAATLGNGVTTSRSYYPHTGRLRDAAAINEGAVLHASSYQYDGRGNVLRVLGETQPDVDSEMQMFAYDELSRLREVRRTENGISSNMTVDYAPNGNIVYKSDVGRYRYDHPQPHAVSSVGQTMELVAGDDQFWYNSNGNQTIRSDTETDYTSFNKPRLIRTGTNEVARYEYDALQSRLLKNGRVVAEVVRAGDERVFYLHRDHRGSVVSITDDEGALVGNRSYDAFGELTSQWSAYVGSVNVGFTGHEDELDLGLINMRGRVYDPRLARFTTPDPFVPNGEISQALNRYSYVLNNPQSLVDPTGFEPIGVCIQSDGMPCGGETTTDNNPWGGLIGLLLDELFPDDDDADMALGGTSGGGGPGSAGGATTPPEIPSWNPSDSGGNPATSNDSWLLGGPMGGGGAVVGPGPLGHRAPGMLGLGSVAAGMEAATMLPAAPGALLEEIDPGGHNLNALAVAAMQTPMPHDDALVLAARGGRGVFGWLARVFCFVAGTLVAGEHGLVAIEEVGVGDLVWAHDVETGETQLRPVVEVSERLTNTLVTLVIAGTEVTTTPEHPFWVEGKGWMKARELTPGDVLWRLDGGTVEVESAQVERVSATVYNLEVDGEHTYFVSDAEVLVHNKLFGRLFGAGSQRTFRVGEVLPGGRVAGQGPGTALRRMLPGNARSTTNPMEVFRRLEAYHGVDATTASQRLHAIKAAVGRGPADNVLFDLT